MTGDEWVSFQKWFRENSSEDGEGNLVANDLVAFCRKMLGTCLVNPDGSQLFADEKQAELLPNESWVISLATHLQGQHEVTEEEAKN